MSDDCCNLLEEYVRFCRQDVCRTGTRQVAYQSGHDCGHSLCRNFVAQRALRLAQKGCSTPGRAIVMVMNRGSRPRKNRIEVLVR